MPEPRDHILSSLKKEILLLQGFKPTQGAAAEIDLKDILTSFPNSTFPTSTLHEFVSNGPGTKTASFGFICSILGSMMQGSPAVWVSCAKNIFPPALAAFGIEPHHFLFVRAGTPKEILWLVEEALKTEGIAAVVGEVRHLSFTESRRLQLSVEKSGVTGFLVREQENLGTTACNTRWKINPLPSESGDLPGIGFPRWQVELLKVRNGKPGSWEVVWRHGKFEVLPKQDIIHQEAQRKAV